MLSLNQDKKSNRLIAIIVGLLILTIALFALAGYLIKPMIVADSAASSLAVSQYGSSLKKAEALVAAYQSDIFSNLSFGSFRSFINLPLNTGQLGKTNPFELPPAPVQDLLDQLIK